MNHLKARLQIVPHLWIDQAEERAHKIVEWYASPEGQRSRSRAYSGEWGAEKDTKRQTIGKVGEVALALFFRLDPAQAINWTYDQDGDGDHDVIVDEKRIDVKTNRASRRECYSSKAVNGHFLQKRFDIIFAVSIEDDWTHCWLEGWETKNGFYHQKRVAQEGDGTNLTPGTWYILKGDLRATDELVPRPAPAPTGQSHVCHYCDACDGTERQVVVAGFIRWLHPQCEIPFKKRIGEFA